MTYIPREAEQAVIRLAGEYRAVALTGPRQSGKTTLIKKLFPEKPYVSFENPDVQEFFEEDPKGFIARYKSGALFDEVQRAPKLFSYLQQVIDEAEKPGLFVLTGSQQFGLLSGITQSLAGRVALVELLPFTLQEWHGQQKDQHPDLDTVLFNGLYPPVHDQNLNPQIWYSNYFRTYVERDVRQMINIKDLNTFRRFVRLCAGRTGQLLNLSSLASDSGITHNTAKSWISILESSYIVFLLQPHHQNFNKRIIKTPKLYFFDTGLAAWLLSIQSPDQLNSYALRGNIFESFIISEIVKSRFNRGLESNLYFWRDRSGNEIDLLIDHGIHLRPIEIKSGKTINKDFFKGLQHWNKLTGSDPSNARLVYGGDSELVRNRINIIPWFSPELTHLSIPSQSY